MYIFFNKSLICAGLMLFIPAWAYAAPLGYQGSVMTMLDYSQNWREASFNYAVTNRDAFGLSHLEMRSDDGHKNRTLDEFTYTRLLSRWNQPSAQSNLWLFLGIGALRGENELGLTKHSFDKVLLNPGLQFDYETTRVYFAATHKLYRAPDINHDFSSVRAGFSFYETDYEKTQPWFIVEARYTKHLSDKVEIIPMLRLINKNFFVEGGINNDGKPRLNMMYTF